MTKTLHWLPIASRVAAGLGGGYAFAWGFTSLVVALSLTAGGDYEEAMTLAYMLAFLVYLCVFLWAFSAASLLRVWVVLAGGGALMTGAALWLTRSLT